MVTKNQSNNNDAKVKAIFQERFCSLRESRFRNRGVFVEEFNNHQPEYKPALSEETVRNWERKKSIPDWRTVLNLCDFFRVDMDFLFGRIGEKTHDIQFIHDQTGLSEKAINLLICYSDFGSYSKADTLNKILESERDYDGSFSSFLDIITGYFRFNIDDSNKQVYTATPNGITYFQAHKAPSGGYAYNPTQAHFRLKDLESMFFLKLWDSLKFIKENTKETSSDIPSTKNDL